LTAAPAAGQRHAMPKPDDKADSKPGRPTLTERGRQQEAERRKREAEALRQNLLRRKQQQRARRQPPGGLSVGGPSGEE
jgi:hypothetical protein